MFDEWLFLFKMNNQMYVLFAMSMKNDGVLS